MKCSECLKELNEMTLYCDRCGAQVSKEKVKLNFFEVEKKVVPLNLESKYSSDLIEDIKKGYFLANIKKDFNGYKKKYIEQYIDYVLLRVYYHKNRVLLTTSDFNAERAVALLESFEKRKPNPIVFEILKEEYGDDYENKIIPKSITANVEHVYCTNFSLGMLQPSRMMKTAFFQSIKGMIKVGVIVALLAAVLFFVVPMFVPNLDLLSIYTSSPLNYVITAVILFVIGYITTMKQREYFPFAHIINSNKAFKKHIKTDMKKRIKTLRYRMKKDARKKN